MREKYGPQWMYQFRGCWAREQQLAPEGDWKIFLILAGRGFGKTRAATEWVKERVNAGARYIALVARTAKDVRDVLVEGPSGILNIYPDKERPLYEPSKCRVTWPNGAIATTYSSEEPDSLRGPQHDTAICDELASWDTDETFHQLMFGMRLGTNPRVMITTTPRPKPQIRKLLKDKHCRVVTASTYENRSNLAADYIERITTDYGGTRLGRQEINAEILDDAEDSLWKTEQLEKCEVKVAPEMRRVVVGIDPSAGKDKGNDEQGIVVCGIGEDGFFYVIRDVTCKKSPEGWAGTAVSAALQYNAGCIVIERNMGGDLAKSVVDAAAKHRGVPMRVKPVLARSGKGARAEPIAALFEQGRVKMLPGLDKLQGEMILMTPNGYEGGGSPNRVDAMCWAMIELAGTKMVSGVIEEKLEAW